MKTLLHPLVVLIGVAVAAAIALRALFLVCSGWIWSLARSVDLNDITPWARWAMYDRDGAEPYALFGVVLLGWVLTGAGILALGRISERPRAIVVAGLLATMVGFAYWWVPPHLPMAFVDARTAAWVLAGC
jgi:hypothetical protein